MGDMFGIIPRVEEEDCNGKLCVNDGGIVHSITWYSRGDIGTPFVSQRVIFLNMDSHTRLSPFTLGRDTEVQFVEVSQVRNIMQQ